MIERTPEGARALLEVLEAQEQALVFDSFENTDALKLGNILAEMLADHPMPTAIRVFLGDIIVFQYARKGNEENFFGWTYRKYQLIKKTAHSSMHCRIRLQFLGELTDLAADRETYGFGCGGFPITVKGQGIVGGVCVSGLPDPLDHEYVVAALAKMLNVPEPKLPEEVNVDFLSFR